MKKAVILNGLCLAMAISGLAQSKEDIAYKKESEEMRKSVWAWNDPKFSVRTIPQKYSGASKIIIAHHVEMTAEAKASVAFYGFAFGTNYKQNVTEVVREVVMLNDKKAVEEYSEFGFTQFVKRRMFISSSKLSTFVGVRVIKSNGSIREMNADDIVLTKDESKEKTAKVAIPDLQPGDILDYFIATVRSATNELKPEIINLLFFDNDPVLSCSFHAELSKRYAVRYREYNRAPQVKIKRNSDDEIIIDVAQTDMAPVETSLWVSTERQLPFVRFIIGQGYRGFGAMMGDHLSPGVVEHFTNGQQALDVMAKDLSIRYSDYHLSRGKNIYDRIEGEAKDLAKQSGLEFKKMTEEEKAVFLYYTFRYKYLLNFSIDKMAEMIDIGSVAFNGAAYQLYCIFKAADMEPFILITDDHLKFRMNETLMAEDFITMAYLPAFKGNFSFYTIFDIPNSVPSGSVGAKGTKTLQFNPPRSMYNPRNDIADIGGGPDLPVSNSVSNARQEKLYLTLTADKSALIVKRKTIVKGFYKYDVQKDLVLYEDFYEEERLAFNEKKSLIEEIADGRSGKKYVEEVKNAFAEARKKQKEAFLQEAKDWFNQEITLLSENKIESLGVRHTAPDLVYSSSFQMGGLIKKAGNNLILEIGKIQGSPLSLKDNQRTRDMDVYMPFARSLEYEIVVQIPDGYTVEGIAPLNKDVSNETGYFKVEASADNSTVTIKIKKHYLHNFELASEFSKLTEIIDAAVSWTNSKLLFKKVK